MPFDCISAALESKQEENKIYTKEKDHILKLIIVIYTIY